MTDEVTFTVSGRRCRLVRDGDGWTVAEPDLDDVKAYGALSGWDDSTLRLVAIAEGVVAGVIEPDEVPRVNRSFARWSSRHLGLNEPSSIWMWTYKPDEARPDRFHARPPVPDALARRIADLPEGKAAAARLTGDTEMLSWLVSVSRGSGGDTVRQQVAKNVATPPEVLRSLADPTVEPSMVLAAVARNPSTPSEVIGDLLSFLAGERVQWNSDAEGDVERRCREALARRTDADRVASHSDWRVRAVVATNPFLPADVLEELRCDEDVTVAAAAHRNR